MPLVKITKPGLAAIALSVALLWGCLFGQRAMMQTALRERAEVMRQLVRERQQTRPVAVPSFRLLPRLRPNAG